MHTNKKKEPSSRSPEKPSLFEVKEASELLSFLLENVSGKGRNAIKSILARGQIFVDGKPETKYNRLLKPGQKVSIYWGKIEEPVKLVGVHILHEDEDVIIVQKEAGLLTIATDKETDLTAYRQLTDYVKRDNVKNRIFIVHRLDRDTSGVMMFAKNEKAKKRPCNRLGRIPFLNVRILPSLKAKFKKPEGTITSWLKESKTMLMYSSQRPDDGQKAVTHYKVLQASRDYSLLEVHLETGRKNQIRVHMKDIGHPIVGDKKYGSKSNTIGRLGLHANVLAFQHPTNGKPLRFESKLPEKFLRPFKVKP